MYEYRDKISLRCSWSWIKIEIACSSKKIEIACSSKGMTMIPISKRIHIMRAVKLGFIEGCSLCKITPKGWTITLFFCYNTYFALTCHHLLPTYVTRTILYPIFHFKTKNIREREILTSGKTVTTWPSICIFLLHFLVFIFL